MSITRLSNKTIGIKLAFFLIIVFTYQRSLDFTQIKYVLSCQMCDLHAC